MQAQHQRQQDNGVSRPTENSDDKAGADDGVVYKKGCVQKSSWWNHGCIERQSSSAFFKLWSQQFARDIKPRVVRPLTGTEKLKWLSKHLNMPDPVSALVRQFLVRGKIPNNAINVDWGVLRYHDHDGVYRKELKGSNGATFVVLDSMNDPSNRYGGSSSDYWAVIDSQNPNRVLITQTVHHGYSASTIVGGIHYFDGDGNLEDRLTPFSTELFHCYSHHHCRPPSPSNVYLSGDTLCHIWSFQGDGEVRVDGWILHEDTIVGKFNGLQDWFKGGSPRHYYFMARVVQERWLCSLCKCTKKWFCLDLKSIRKAPGGGNNNGDDNEERQNTTTPRQETLYDCLEIPSSMDVLTTIQSLANDIPSHDITTRDGYPAKCIKCSKSTANGQITFPTGSFGGLGKGVCEDCKIRFSFSKKHWECWKMVSWGNDNINEYKIGQCYQKVDASTQYQCTAANHVPDEDLSLTIRHDAKKRKRRGYQDDISVSFKYSKKATSTTTAGEGTS